MEPTDVGGCIPALADVTAGFSRSMSRRGGFERGRSRWCGVVWCLVQEGIERGWQSSGGLACAWGRAGAAEQGRGQFGERLAGAGAGDLLCGVNGLRRRGVVGACWPRGVARGRAAGEVERAGGLEREARRRVERARGVRGDAM
jgi:hypothetical protein